MSERTSTGTYYYSLNSLGSVSVVTDSTGAVKNTYAYDPWGNSLGKTEAVSNPWQFAGGFYDATTGIVQVWDAVLFADVGTVDAAGSGGWECWAGGIGECVCVC